MERQDWKLGCLIKMKHRNSILQDDDLLFEGLWCGSGLLNERRVMWRHLADLCDCLVDLFDTVALFVRRSLDLVHDAGDALSSVHGFVNRLLCVGHERCPLFYLGGRFAMNFMDFLRD